MPIHANWKVDHKEVLRERFNRPFLMQFPITRISDPSLLYETQIFLQNIKIFVNIRMQVEGYRLALRQGFFFDESAIARRRGREDGYIQWTEALVDPEDRRTN